MSEDIELKKAIAAIIDPVVWGTAPRAPGTARDDPRVALIKANEILWLVRHWRRKRPEQSGDWLGR